MPRRSVGPSDTSYCGAPRRVISTMNEEKLNEFLGTGFTRFRRAAETPFNLVYEVRP